MDEETIQETPAETPAEPPVQEDPYIGSDRITNYRGSDWLGNTQIVKQGKYANIIHDDHGRAIRIKMPDGTEKTVQRNWGTGQITGIEGEGDVFKGTDVNKFFDLT